MRPLDRRDFLCTSAGALLGAACTEPSPTMATRTDPPMPVVFVSHGAPTLAIDAAAGRDFTALGTALGRPRAILVVSAHWLDAPPTLGTRTPRPLYRDFSGFPEALQHVQYDAPAAADLAADLQQRLSLAHDDVRPWDHGVWVPLVHMFPQHDVPVLQLSMPFRWTPQQMFALGRQLAPLRQEGVLVLASGGAVHNLGRLDWRSASAAPAWATTFEGWLQERLAARAFDDVVGFREKAPDLALAHPTDDHFVPMLVAVGAATDGGDVTFPIRGFEYGSLSRLAVRFG